MFGVDTGRNITALTKSYVDRSKAEFREDKKTIVGFNGPVEMNARCLNDTVIEVSEKKEIYTELWDTAINPCSVTEIDGVIGSDILKSSIVRFDCLNQRLEIKKNG